MKFSRSLKFALFLSGACLVITIGVIFIQGKTVSAFRKDIPLAKLADHISSRVNEAIRHHQNYVYMADRSVDHAQQVTASLKYSQARLQAAYTSESSIDDEDTRALLKESEIAVEQLALTFGQQYEKASQGIAADATDKANFATASAAATASLDKLNRRLQIVIDSDTASIDSMRWIATVLLLGGFALLVTVVYRTQRKSEKAINLNNVKLEEETKRVSTLSQFIEGVSSGNYDMELKAGNDSDNLTGTLINMRDKLRQNADDDRKRNWATTGQAQIGEILRTNMKASDLYDNIVRFLVKYTKSNQGGLFLVNDEVENHKHLDLVACYAFERKKYLTKSVDIGDGLVGQCYLEGMTIHLIEVPQEYVSITSGLGGANPSSLLIVPMKVNDQIYGVIELASFTRYAPYEIELVEKLAESIASTISNVRVNETTRTLLEKTQQQAEEMKSQEEEIRQNMEELEATQEEMRRKQSILETELAQSQKQADALREQERSISETTETLQAIVDNIPRAIFWKDRELKFRGCNRIFSNIAGAESPGDLYGKTDFDMAWSAQADAYRKDDMDVMNSRVPKLDIEEVNINSDGAESWVRTSKVPIITKTGEVVAILGMFEDITALKRREADVTRKLKEREEALEELKSLRDLLSIQKTMANSGK
jgi:PAS domain S-box-containing protein